MNEFSLGVSENSVVYVSILWSVVRNVGIEFSGFFFNEHFISIILLTILHVLYCIMFCRYIGGKVIIVLIKKNNSVTGVGVIKGG